MSNPAQATQPPGRSFLTFTTLFLRNNWLLFVILGCFIIVFWRIWPDEVVTVLFALSITLSVVSFLFILLYILWALPRWQVKNIECKEASELFALENEARKTIAQVIGGLLLLIGFYFTWENLRITQDNAQKTQRMTEGQQVSERLNRATTQIGSKTMMEARLGGIHELELIARDFDIGRRASMDILTAFIRERTSLKQENERQIPPPHDIQAALSAIGRQRVSDLGSESLNLERTFLQEANLKGANLQGFNLAGANLSYANLVGATLRNANLRDANLTGARLDEALLQGADFTGTVMTDATMASANVISADFRLTPTLTAAQIFGARNNSSAWLSQKVDEELTTLRRDAARKGHVP